MASQYTVLFYDALTGEFLESLPVAGLSFGSQLNEAKQLSGSINPQDPGMQQLDVWGATRPGRTVVAVDFEGSIVWTGLMVTPRTFTLSKMSQFPLQANELWSYWTRRVQATDYSSPPYSGITGTSTNMYYWDATNTGVSGVYDPVLIAWQLLYDASNYTNAELGGTPITYGSLLGGLPILANGQSNPADYLALSTATPSANYINITYPFASLQTVDSMISQISDLGLGVGFDFGIDVGYSSGPGSVLSGAINLSTPTRGRPYTDTNLVLDSANFFDYTVTEAGDQAAWQLYERGGSGAIGVEINVNPQLQGYPLLESVIDHSYIVSGDITQILSKVGLADLYVYSYPPTTFQITCDPSDPACPLGSFVMGDEVFLTIQPDVRFPNGLQGLWRITGNQVTVPDQGQATQAITLSPPPAAPLGPFV